MKNKPLQFHHGYNNSEVSGGGETLPRITLPDGSVILLSGHDPACPPRNRTRFARHLPTLDTRNRLGLKMVNLCNILDSFPQPEPGETENENTVRVQEWATVNAVLLRAVIAS